MNFASGRRGTSLRKSRKKIPRPVMVQRVGSSPSKTLTGEPPFTGILHKVLPLAGLSGCNCEPELRKYRKLPSGDSAGSKPGPPVTWMGCSESSIGVFQIFTVPNRFDEKYIQWPSLDQAGPDA